MGFGAACNRGVSAAGHPLALLLNNDVALDASAIAPLAGAIRTGAIRRVLLFAVHCRVLDFDTGAEAGTGQAGRIPARIHPRARQLCDAEPR